MADRRHVPVLIVGGGPVGLALAADLGWRGVRCELVEQSDGAIATPKMNEVNVRTMEFCRRWGIADRVHGCPFPADYPLDVVFVTSLAGYELARMRREPRARQTPECHSPMRLQICSQLWFDPILRSFAQSRPTVRLRYRTRLETFADEGGRVAAELTDLERGGRERVTADYLVACDGAGSMVREALGIGLSGQGVLGHPVHLFFRAPDLLARCGREAGTFFLAIDRDGLWANIRIIDPANAIWRLMVLDTDGTATPQTIDRDALLARALGRRLPAASLEVEWLGSSVWTRRSLVADRYGEGRVFLAGDAVHQLSPTGALGMNTGIGDAVDLGWKLAAMVQGWGGRHLPASYEAERRPVGLRNVAMATEFYLAHELFGDGAAALASEASGQRGHSISARAGHSPEPGSSARAALASEASGQRGHSISVRAQPISGLPEIGHVEMRKSGKPDLRSASEDARKRADDTRPEPGSSARAAIEDDDEDGRALRARLGEALARDVGRMFRTIGLQLGYRYEGSPICIGDGTPAPPDDPETFVASARPGSRAPHVVLADGSSTLDLFGHGYTLLRLGIDAPDGRPLADAAAQRGVPLRTVTLEEPAVLSAYERRLALVRPDGHVAWRGDDAPADADGVIDRVRGSLSA